MTAVTPISACVTMLFAASCAMAAVEVKRVLAWSTVSQLAIMFAGLSLGTHDGRHADLGVRHDAVRRVLRDGRGGSEARARLVDREPAGDHVRRALARHA